MPRPFRSPGSPRFRIPGPLLALALVLGTACGRSDRSPPFIVILVDTLRADYLGCFGFDGPVSPRVDRLAGESVIFRRCYAPSPWTKPTVASLFEPLRVLRRVPYVTPAGSALVVGRPL